MARLYRMADVTVSVPSSEGYGFTVYEAMACGCATLIFELPVFKHRLADGVHTLKVQTGDAEITTEKLAELLAKAKKRRQLSRNALTVVQDHSVKHRVEHTNALYGEVTSGQADRPPATWEETA